MSQNRFGSTLGVRIFGLAAICLGVLGLVWGDFAVNWQRVAETIPHHLALARAAAICEIVLGAALLWRRTARRGALLLAAFYSIFVALWLVHALSAPKIYDSWGNVFEELSLVLAGIAVFTHPGKSVAWQRATAIVCGIYGVCTISFAVDHFVYLSGAATFVPAWIPPGQKFWVLATAICFLCAAAAIFSGVLAGLATRLLTVMILGFGLLVWLPKLVAQPHQHFMWAGNAINFALMASAWVLADTIAMRNRQPAGAVSAKEMGIATPA